MKKGMILAAVLAGTTGAALAQTPGVAPMAPHGAGHMAMPQTRDAVVAQVRDHFARADANRDGFVAADEMQAMRGQRKAQRPRRQRPIPSRSLAACRTALAALPMAAHSCLSRAGRPDKGSC